MWVAALSCGIVACVGGRRIDQPLFSVENEKYALVAEFYGKWVGPDGDPQRQFLVRRLVIKDSRTSESAEYRRIDVDSPADALGFFSEVWSPDREYLVLPAGRFAGYVVFEAPSSIERVRADSPTDSVAVRFRGLPESLNHQFVGWMEAHELQFDVTFESSTVSFGYNLERQELAAKHAPIVGWSAVNGGGNLVVGWNR